MIRLVRTQAFAVALSLVCVVTSARADWPMARHDPQHRATSDHPSDLRTPAVVWREYLGGALASDSQIAADVNGDGAPEVIFISGGRLLAKRPDDSLLWQTLSFDLNRLDGVRDIDNDGTMDVIAHGLPGRVVIVSGRDGHVEWQTSTPTFGPSLGAVRFADLDHDSHDDLYVADIACGSTGSLGDVAIAYTFARGFGSGIDNGDQRLWGSPSSNPNGTLERGRDYNCGANDVVADLDRDGTPEIVTFGTNYLYLFDGRTGAKVPCPGSPDPQGGFPIGFSLPYGQGATDVVDVDHDGLLDIVVYTNGSYTPAINSRLAYVISYDPSRPAATRLRVRWHRGVADVALDSHSFNHRGAADFDGDGMLEIATTFVESGTPTTYVFNGGTGATLVAIPGASIVTVASFATGERPTLVLRRGSNIEGYRFDAFGPVDAGGGAPRWTIPAGGMLNYFDRRISIASSATTTPLLVPIHGTTRMGLLIVRTDVELWDVGAMPTPTAPVATLALGTDLSVLSVQPENGILGQGPGVLLARSDGYLLVLDDQLHTINFGGLGEITLPGIRIGGYYSGASGLGAVPIATRFPDTRDDVPAHDEVLATTSRGRLTRFDAARASLLEPPAVRWEWPNAQAPMAIDTNGDGVVDQIAAYSGPNVIVRAPDGATRVFQTRVGDATNPLDNASRQLSLVRHQGSLEISAVVADSGDGTARVARLTSAGAIRWSSAPLLWAGSSLGNLVTDDPDGDGDDDDIIDITGQLRLFSATDGSLVATGIQNHSLSPMNVRGLAGAGPVTLLTGGSVSELRGATVTRAATSSITTVWSFPASYDHTNQSAGILRCAPSRIVTAIGVYSRPLVAIADVASGTAAAGPPFEMYLAGGRTFASQADLAAAGANPGQIGNIVATNQLYAGQSALLVPSSDGYLYAIDPCAATPRLLWSINFRAPVGEPIFADADGDGSDEIVLEAADGFLYGLDTAQLPAPEWVHDTDPTSASTDDVNDTYGSAIEAAWSPVTGATEYEVAVFTYGDTPVFPVDADGGTAANPYVRVPASGPLRASFANVQDGHWYYFSVRAIGATGNSGDTQSDGTTFHRRLAMVDAGVPDSGVLPMDAGPMRDVVTTTDSGPAQTGCACASAPGRGAGRELWIALGAIMASASLVSTRRRRRQTR